jgi:hypothetical protein
MAILNTQETFSDAQAVTSTAISTNVIDLNVIGGPNTTQGIADTVNDLYLVVFTKTTATDSGSDATLTVTLESDSTANLATSATVHYSTGAMAFATYATAGTRLAAIKLPAGQYERYLGVRYTVASGPLTAGAFTAYLTRGIDSNTAYARGYVHNT